MTYETYHVLPFFVVLIDWDALRWWSIVVGANVGFVTFVAFRLRALYKRWAR